MPDTSKSLIFVPGEGGFIRWHVVRQARLRGIHTSELGEADAIIYCRGPGDPRDVTNISSLLATFEKDFEIFRVVHGDAIFKRTIVLSSLDVSDNVSPYTALCLAKEAIARQHGCTILRTSCVFGPYMQRTKFIYKMLQNTAAHMPVPIHKDATRPWTYVEDLARHLVKRLDGGWTLNPDARDREYVSYTATPLHLAEVAADLFQTDLRVRSWDFHGSPAGEGHTRSVTSTREASGLVALPTHLALTAEWMGVLP